MGDEKARLGLSFMYNAPGMLKGILFYQHTLKNLPQLIHDPFIVDQQDKKPEEKFEWQKNAPREQ